MCLPNDVAPVCPCKCRRLEVSHTRRHLPLYSRHYNSITKADVIYIRSHLYVTGVTGISPTLKVEVNLAWTGRARSATCYSGSASFIPISMSLIKASFYRCSARFAFSSDWQICDTGYIRQRGGSLKFFRSCVMPVEGARSRIYRF